MHKFENICEKLSNISNEHQLSGVDAMETFSGFCTCLCINFYTMVRHFNQRYLHTCVHISAYICTHFYICARLCKHLYTISTQEKLSGVWMHWTHLLGATTPDGLLSFAELPTLKSLSFSWSWWRLILRWFATFESVFSVLWIFFNIWQTGIHPKVCLTLSIASLPHTFLWVLRHFFVTFSAIKDASSN